MLETYPDPAALDRERYQASGGERDERIDHPTRESEARMATWKISLVAAAAPGAVPRTARGGPAAATTSLR